MRPVGSNSECVFAPTTELTPGRLRKKGFSATCSLTLVSPRGREVKESGHLLCSVWNAPGLLEGTISFFPHPARAGSVLQASTGVGVGFNRRRTGRGGLGSTGRWRSTG